MKKNVLVTGGTVFVSRYVAEYYVKKGCAVTVLNRNTRPQPEGAAFIEADRHALEEGLAQAFRWYAGGGREVRKKPFLAYIDQHLQDLPLTETDREGL